jgi:hypothetical protein
MTLIIDKCYTTKHHFHSIIMIKIIKYFNLNHLHGRDRCIFFAGLVFATFFAKEKENILKVYIVAIFTQGAWKRSATYGAIDWLIIYCFKSCSRIFHLYGDLTITGEMLQNLGLCSAFRAFEQEGFFIVPHLLWHGASVFLVSSEGPPHSIASYDTQGDVEDLF